MFEAVLAAGRVAAEARMVDTCRITRGGGEPVWDEETGTYTPAGAVLLYGPADSTGKAGRCLVQTYQAFEQTPNVGEQRIVVQRYYLHVPVGEVKYQSGDDVEILSSKMNPALPGTLFQVAGAHDKTAQTAHRLLVDEVLPRG